MPGTTTAIIVDFGEYDPWVGIKVVIGCAAVVVPYIFLSVFLVYIGVAYQLTGLVYYIYKGFLFVSLFIMLYILYGCTKLLKRSFVPSWSKATPTDWENKSLFHTLTEEQRNDPNIVYKLCVMLCLFNGFIFAILIPFNMRWASTILFPALTHDGMSAFYDFLIIATTLAAMWTLPQFFIIGIQGVISFYSHSFFGASFFKTMTIVIFFIIGFMFFDAILKLCIPAVDFTSWIAQTMHFGAHWRDAHAGILFQGVPIMKMVF